MAVNKFDNSMFDAGTIGTTANKLVQLDGSAKIPAVDGSLLTGIPSSFTKSASDPTISTNPSGGVGSLWANTTSGEVYCCTDATAGANVWTNIGAGTGNVQPWLFQGTQYGYHFGSGDQDNGSVQRVSFTSDGNATDVGSVTVARDTWAGCAGETHGYLAGGYVGGAHQNVIDRLEYAADSSMSDVGDLTSHRRSTGASNNKEYGYIHGGYQGPPSSATNINIIERFQMVASANAADVGDLSVARNYPGGNSDVGNSYGYCTGGYPGTNNTIDRYQMQASSNAVDVGDMIYPQASHANQSTETYGYQSGGGEPSQSNYIRKFAFGSSITSTDVGNLTVARYDLTGVTSTTYGYCMGGIWPDSNNTIIEKFSLASDVDATDVGDLATAGGRYNGPTGAHY
jgi:hypothetical protein